jgi:YfiR/HmsC-like
VEQVTRKGVGGCKLRSAWRLHTPVFRAGLGIVLSLIALVASLAADEPLEYQVKAAFLLNFTKFVEWPASAFERPDSPISICVLGDDPFGRALDEIVAGEVVSGRKVAAQRIKRVPPPRACQVLFAGRSEKDIAELLPGLGRGVLTVGEGEGFLLDGGMIAFVIENRRVRFEINQTVAERAGLKLSAKLLTVAKAVEK